MKILLFLLLLIGNFGSESNNLHGRYRVINKPYNSGLDFWIFDISNNSYSATSKQGTTYGKITKIEVGEDIYFYLQDTINPFMQTKLDSLLFKNQIIEIKNPKNDTINFRITSAIQLNITSGSGTMVKY